jgi:hypothetical protein
MRFHPNKRASTDQAPGPSSAKAAPRVPSRIPVHGSPGCEKACQNAMTDTSVPAMGVHRPASRRIPTAVVTACSMNGPGGGSPSSCVTPRTMDAIPAASLINSRPIPGNPWANVENSRRTTRSRLQDSVNEEEAPKGRCKPLFRVSLELDDAALHPDHCRVCPVVGT